MDAAEFWSICSVNGLVLSQEQMAQFERYAGDLVYWNERVNLISRRDIQHLWLRHFIHSLGIVFSGEMPVSGKVLDIGTGGGLPGIPLKIALPKLDVTLVDSIAKKVQTTSMLASHITKHGLRAVRVRAEELANDPKLKGPYDVVVSRATAPLVDLMKWSLPLLKSDGKILTLKGGALVDEVDQARAKFPDSQIEVIEVRPTGVDWFEKEEKRLVKATRPGRANAKGPHGDLP